ncbi:transposase family protein [Moorena sp. SIO4A1]|uniref:transposase family protein n=1 Tax=Moorena sp. SIO4A1 TaxID=2607835 RepID=UPI00344B7CBB
MEKSLIDYLKEIPDHRSPHGLRHPLWLVLLIIIMGMMSGYWGYRQLGRFVERHRTQLISRLKIHACSCSFLFSNQKSHD